MKICSECKDVIMYCKCIEEYFEKERKKSEMIDYRTNETELIKKAKSIEGMNIIDVSDNIKIFDNKPANKTKSVIANIVESNFFNIPTNSSEKPDFQQLGIELKVSPLKHLPSLNIYNMKERCVLKMIDYYDVYENENWENSKLYKKINKILFVLYLHDFNKAPKEWKFIKTLKSTTMSSRLIYTKQVQEQVLI